MSVWLANGWTLRKRQEECHDKLIEAYNKGYKDFFIAAVCRLVMNNEFKEEYKPFIKQVKQSVEENE